MGLAICVENRGFRICAEAHSTCLVGRAANGNVAAEIFGSGEKLGM